MKWRNNYRIAEQLKDLVPSEFRSQFDQIITKIKLSSGEEKLINQAEKIVNDFITSKGGKQWNIYYYLFCSVCDSELEVKLKDFAEKNSDAKSIQERMDEMEEELNKIWQKLDENKQDELREKMNEFEAEIFGVAEENGNPNDPNKDKPDNSNTKKCATCEKDISGQSETYASKGKNYCSPICRDKGSGVDISNQLTQLQQEVNSLKQEIRDLKNPRSTPADPNTLSQKEKELEDKENQLNKLEGNDKNKDQSRSPNKNNSNRTLYIILGIGGAIIIFLLAVFWWKKPRNT